MLSLILSWRSPGSVGGGLLVLRSEARLRCAVGDLRTFPKVSIVCCQELKFLKLGAQFVQCFEFA